MDPDDAFHNSVKLVKEARKLIKDYQPLDSYRNVVYWIEKVFVKDPEDIFNMASGLFMTERYMDAIKLIKHFQAHNLSTKCKFLLARCYIKLNRYGKAGVVLDSNLYVEQYRSRSKIISDDSVSEERQIEEICAVASMLVLRGQIYENVENTSSAVACYAKALNIDICCYSAFSALVDRHLLPPYEIAELLDSLELSTDDDLLMRDTLKTLLHPLIHGQMERKLTNTVPKSVPDMECSVCSLPKLPDAFYNDIDIKTSKAHFTFSRYNYRECYKLCKEVLAEQKFHDKTLILYTACLTHFSKALELFKLGHEQIDARPRSAVPWYISGCYYLLSEDYVNARAHFSKSIDIDKNLVEAWIAYGHSFSYANASDQAFAAYLQAQRLNPRHHLPALCLGSESLKLNSATQALYYLEIALDIAPNDPEILNELAVAYYFNENYSAAETSLLWALRIYHDHLQLEPHKKWEALFVNLGMVSWRLKKYNAAINYYEKALQIDCDNYSTMINMCFVLLDTDKKMACYRLLQKILSLKSNDEIATTLENYVMRDCEEWFDKDDITTRTQLCKLSISDEKISTGIRAIETVLKGSVDSGMEIQEESDVEQELDPNRALFSSNEVKRITDLHPLTRFLSIQDAPDEDKTAAVVKKEDGRELQDRYSPPVTRYRKALLNLEEAGASSSRFSTMVGSSRSLRVKKSREQKTVLRGTMEQCVNEGGDKSKPASEAVAEMPNKLFTGPSESTTADTPSTSTGKTVKLSDFLDRDEPSTSTTRSQQKPVPHLADLSGAEQDCSKNDGKSKSKRVRKS